MEFRNKPNLKKIVVSVLFLFLTALLVKSVYFTDKEVVTSTKATDELQNQIKELNNSIKNLSIQIRDTKLKIESIDFGIEVIQTELKEIPTSFEPIKQYARNSNDVDSLIQIALQND